MSLRCVFVSCSLAVLALGWQSALAVDEETEHEPLQRLFADAYQRRYLNCLGRHGNPRYCVQDPVFIGPIARQVLQREFGGRWPPFETDQWDQLARRFGSAYFFAIGTPAGVARVEARIRAQYAEPIVTVRALDLLIDAGIPPGQVAYGPRSQTLRYVGTPLFRNGEFSGREVARILASQQARHPTAQRLTLAITLPHVFDQRLVYHYHPKDQRLVIENARGKRTIQNVDLQTYGQGHPFP